MLQNAHCSIVQSITVRAGAVTREDYLPCIEPVTIRLLLLTSLPIATGTFNLEQGSTGTKRQMAIWSPCPDLHMTCNI